jgi:uncharacterized protein
MVNNQGKMSRVNLTIAVDILENIFVITKPDGGHGISHALIVHNHAINSIKEHPEMISEDEALSIELAALLHDVGDGKFVDNVEHGYWEGYFFDRYFLEGRNVGIFDRTMSMISIVSCSKFGDLYVGGKTLMYIVRYSDRLESIGVEGLNRTLIYSDYKQRPMYDENTKRATTLDELGKIAGLDRYRKYVKSGGKYTEYNTTIDHLYDKPLHINIPSWMENPYLEREFMSRRSFLAEWILKFWSCMVNQQCKR